MAFSPHHSNQMTKMGIITYPRTDKDQNFLDCLSNYIQVLWTNYHQWTYRKTSKWINTIRYTNINTNKNKRMKTNIKSVTEHSNTYTNVSVHQNKKTNITWYIDMKKM